MIKKMLKKNNISDLCKCTTNKNAKIIFHTKQKQPYQAVTFLIIFTEH